METMSYRRRALTLLLCTALALPGLAACGEDADTAESPAPQQQKTDSAAADSSQKGGTREPAFDLSARTIAIDPGHNGGNASHPSKINRPVPDGRGGTKPCNTTGTSTTDDYPETDFTWGVSKVLKKDLEEAGATVILSRQDNKGVGPCVDERGKFADAADVMVSIHANGTDSTSAKGFHVIVAEPGRDKATEKDSNRLAKSMSGAMADRFTPNKAYGKNAISRRPDLAGLNNASVPAVIVECGEMRNPAEAKLMKSKSGQEKYASALMQGIIDWY